MACLIRTRKNQNPTWTDTFLKNNEKKATDDFIVDTNEEKTGVFLINKNYSQIEVRKNGSFENFFENRIVLDKQQDMTFIHFDQTTHYQIWHEPLLIQYLDSEPGEIVK